VKREWTEERVELLRQLAAERYSAGRIAAELGGVTRCAVLGKAKREGIKVDSGVYVAWSDAEDARLKEAVASGLMPRQIKALFPDRPAAGITSRRLRLGAKTGRSKRHHSVARPQSQDDAVMRVVPPPVVAERALPANPTPFIELRKFRTDAPNQCRHFLGGHSGAEGLVCADATEPGKSWCPSCARVLLRPVPVPVLTRIVPLRRAA
jgi:GcrA cell cycle regulator